MTERPTSLVQIARALSLTPGALSNWQRRYDDFPAPTSMEGMRRFYLMSEIQSFMDRHDLKVGEEDERAPNQRRAVALEGNLIRQLASSFKPVAPLGFKSLLAASLLAIISEERPEGLRSLGALNEATVTAKDPNGDLRAGLDAIKMLPDHVISEILQAWHGAASKIDRRRVSGALRRYVDETSTRKLGAEFTTSTSVAKLIEEITSGLDVLDMCCGYGTTLREFRRKTRVRVGQEINHEVATLARLLARVEGYEVEILNEDSLAVCHTDWLRIGFHTVIVDPPMGVRLREDQVSPTDLRWTHSAVARSTQAEDYWIQSALAYLRPSSVEAPFRAVVILRSGWFFDGSGGPFRDALLKAGVVEAVISLGSGTKMSTAIPVSILVLRKAGIGSAKVRMIDATEAGRVRRGVRELELEEIKAIAAAMNGRETGQTISTVKVLDVPIQEVLQNGSVLDVRRYLPNDRSAASLGMAVKELNKVVDLLSKAFRAIGDSLSELNPTGILDVDSMSSSGLQLVKLASDEMQSNLVQSYFKSRRPGEEWSTDDVRPSDVVVSMMGVGAGSAISGRELIAKQPAWTKVWILRTVRERIDPEYLLAWARYGGLETQTRRLISRSTVPTLAMRDIKQISLPVVDFETQKRIAIWGKRLDELSERLLVLGDVQAEFIGAAKGVTSAFFVELDRRESKP